MKSIKTNLLKFILAQNTGDAGFTLIELIMIIVILSVAIVSMMNLSSSILVKSSKSSTLSQAVIYAEEKMEEIRADKNNPARGYEWITTAGNYSSESLPNGYTRSVNVEEDTHNGIDYALIEVVISHSDFPDYTLTTWLTDY